MTSRYIFRRKPSQRPKLFFALTITAVFVVIWLAGFLMFVDQIPRTVTDAKTGSDAIIVLTGGSKRVETGIALLRKGSAKRLYISGVGQKVGPDQIGRLVGDGEVALPPATIACCVTLGHKARHTVGNAAEIADWASRDGLSSIRLVTANYHMSRAGLEVSRAVPILKIIPHPVFPDEVHIGAWWLWPGTASLLFLEYHKFLLAKLRHAISDLLIGPKGELFTPGDNS